MVSEHHGDFFPAALIHRVVRPIELVRLFHRVLAVPGEAVHAQRLGQHLLVRRHPLDFGVGDHLHDLLSHGAFSGPHPAGWSPEVGLVKLHAFPDLGDGIVGIGEAVRQFHVRHGDFRQVRVVQERQNRVGVGRHGHFDLPRVLELLVLRNDCLDELQVLGEDGRFVRFCEVLFLRQRLERLLRQDVRVHPRQVEPYLQITVILGGEIPQGLVDGRLGSVPPALVQQRFVLREPPDDVIPVGIEEAPQDEPLVLFGELVGGLLRQHPVLILRPVGKVVQLADEGRRQVERHVDFWVFRHGGSHVVVILDSVHPHPGTGVNAGLRVFVVERLVLMPDDRQVYRLFGDLRRRRRGFSWRFRRRRNSGRNRRCRRWRCRLHCWRWYRRRRSACRDNRAQDQQNCQKLEQIFSIHVVNSFWLISFSEGVQCRFGRKRTFEQIGSDQNRWDGAAFGPHPPQPLPRPPEWAREGLPDGRFKRVPLSHRQKRL